MPVGRARITPQAVSKGSLDLARPGLEPDKLGAAAEVQYHTASLVVAPAQPPIDRRVRVACSFIIVAAARRAGPVHRLPQHEAVLPELALHVSARRDCVVTTDGPVLNRSEEH